MVKETNHEQENNNLIAPRLDPELWDEIYTYIQAMINLYGIIHREKVVEIFNMQNDHQISLSDLKYIEADERIRRMETAIGIKDEYFVNLIIMILEKFDKIMKHKEGKPYYIPEKEELLKYADKTYFEINEQYEAVRDFFRKRFWRKSKADELAREIKSYCSSADSMANIGRLFEERDLKIKTEEEVRELMELIMNLANHTRVWENNGLTPHEMEEIMRGNK